MSNEFIPAVDLALPLRQDGAVESLVAVVAREARFVPGAPSTAHQLCDEHLERRSIDNAKGDNIRLQFLLMYVDHFSRKKQNKSIIDTFNK